MVFSQKHWSSSMPFEPKMKKGIRTVAMLFLTQPNRNQDITFTTHECCSKIWMSIYRCITKLVRYIYTCVRVWIMNDTLLFWTRTIYFTDPTLTNGWYGVQLRGGCKAVILHWNRLAHRTSHWYGPSPSRSRTVSGLLQRYSVQILLWPRTTRGSIAL